jgi:ABC-type transporter Mla subunit MlaD
MADDGRTAEWDEVGRRFGDLGHKLQDAWTGARPEGSEAGDSGHGVTAALEDLKASISHTVTDPEVRAAATNATSGFADALAANLRQLADWIEHRPSGPSGSGDTVSTEKPSD